MLIPSHNRALHVKRLLGYLAAVNCNFPVIVADSSNIENGQQQATKEFTEALKSRLDIQYLYFPQETNFPLKFFRALSTIKTPYSVICGDDDFLIPESVSKCVEFLESHPDYALANGHAIAFRLQNGASVHGEIESIKRYPQSAIEEDSSGNRLLHHCSVYRVSMYSVQRTSLIIEAWQQACNFNLEFGEIAPSFCSLIQGKRANLDLLYLVRELHAASGTSVFVEDTFGWIGAQRWSYEYNQLLDSMSSLLVKYEGQTPHNARVIAKHAFWVYITDRLASNLRLPLQIPYLPGNERTYCEVAEDPRLHQDALLSGQSEFWPSFEPLYKSILG
jgi:glycosyltransferase domain-containing protein